jgi:hypothetical protein
MGKDGSLELNEIPSVMLMDPNLQSPNQSKRFFKMESIDMKDQDEDVDGGVSSGEEPHVAPEILTPRKTATPGPVVPPSARERRSDSVASLPKASGAESVKHNLRTPKRKIDLDLEDEDDSDDDIDVGNDVDRVQQLDKLRRLLQAKQTDLNNINKQCKGLSPNERKKVLTYRGALLTFSDPQSQGFLRLSPEEKGRIV